MRLLIGLVALALGGLVLAQDTKVENARAGRMQAIRDEAARAVAEFNKTLDGKSPQDKQKLTLDFQRATIARAAKWAERALEIAKQNPKDDLGCEALVFAARNAAPGAKLRAEAAQLLKAHHRADPRIEPVFFTLMRSEGAFDVGFLRAVFAENPAREVKALAKLGLAFAVKEDAEGPKPSDEELPNKLRQAEEALEAFIEEYGDIKLQSPPIRLADLAVREINAMKASPIGKEVLEIKGEDLEGKPFKLSDYRGKVVLLDFWGFWCPQCVKMFPHGRTLVKRLESRPFALVGVNSDKDRDACKKKHEQEQVTWRSFWAGKEGSNGSIPRDFNVRSWPTLYLIDHNGIVRRRLVGDPGEAALDRLIDELVKKAESARKSS